MGSNVFDEELNIFLEKGCNLNQLKVMLELSLHGILIRFIIILLNTDIEG